MFDGMRSKKFVSCIGFGVLLSLNALAYDAGAFSGETPTFIKRYNEATKGLLPVFSSMRRSQPIRPLGSAFNYSLDVSIGQALSPVFAFASPSDDLKLFGPTSVYRDSPGESLAGVNAGLMTSMPWGMLATLNASWSPRIRFGYENREYLKLNGSAYVKLLDEEAFVSMGLFAGTGYTFITGATERELNLSYTEAATTTAFAGTVSTKWNYHMLDGELFLHKSLSIVNFYARTMMYALFGEIASSLGGTLTNPSRTAGLSVKDDSIGFGVILSGGMEINFGFFKLGVEAGRDWVTEAFYGCAGIRLGI